MGNAILATLTTLILSESSSGTAFIYNLPNLHFWFVLTTHAFPDLPPGRQDQRRSSGVRYGEWVVWLSRDIILLVWSNVIRDLIERDLVGFASRLGALELDCTSCR